MGIKLLALDVDGVMTDGTILYTGAGEDIKAFHAHDGLGLKLLNKLGIELAVISGRTSAPLTKRLDDLGIYHRRLKCSDKITALNDICGDLGITLDEVAFMGDDLIDLAAMDACAYGLAPANAVAEVKAAADWVSERAGGHGAVRDACEHLAEKMGTRLADALAGTKVAQ
ncbi:MAG: HAD hydrolase family protein [Kordiimonadaceae bacterium]|nr:HAD hydrolase family protein [Kordiimonadaceae bacterium]